MNKLPVSSRFIVFAILFSFLFFIILVFQDFFYNKTKIVFCDVGQGDGAYIRTSEKVDILIDAGPDRKILDCLGKYMPFYDRKIELAFLSHPEKDHYGGYLYIIDRYTIDNFITSGLSKDSQSFSLLKRKLKDKKIPIKNLYSGDIIRLGEAKINILWPKKQLVTGKISNFNGLSEIIIFSENNSKALFTGDINTSLCLDCAINVNVLKVSHHGSKNGLTKKFLLLADPALSVISVGRNNGYGHPSKEVLDMLKALGKKYLRTDQAGDIVIEIGERGWKVK